MKKIYNAACLLALLFTACKKEGTILVEPVTKISNFTIRGFVAGETLEQYFDGAKVRELRGRIGEGQNQIVFHKDSAAMEIRRQQTGEVLFRKTFYAKDADNKVPLFYFEKGWKDKYAYPVPEGTDYLANFYMDFPADSGAADVALMVTEYYWDWDNMDDPQKIIGETIIPVAKNITGKWSEYIKLKPLADLPHTRPDSEFWPVAVLLKAGTGEYYIANNASRSSFNMQVPQGWESEGTVQSFYFMPGNARTLVTTDLAAMYPR